MSLIEVTASVAFSYDTEDGLVASGDDAVQDVVEILLSGDLSPGDFQIDWVEA